MVLTNEWRMSRAAIEGETVARAMQARRARHCHFIPIAPLFTIINNYHIIFPIIDPSFIMLYHTLFANHIDRSIRLRRIDFLRGRDTRTCSHRIIVTIYDTTSCI